MIFAPNHDLTIDIVRIGEKQEPVLVIDGFLAAPEALVDYAKSKAQWAEAAPGRYPGRQAPLPGAYARAVLYRVDQIIRRRILTTDHSIERFDCAFSVVTRAPEALTALQRVPHIDAARETRVAVLHYLCSAAFGGTAFFRQTATGLEQVGPSDRDAYIAARTQDLASLSVDDGYPDQNTPCYRRTGLVQAGFNRLILYRSCNLHSGIIDAPDRLSDDPATGRLTANFFIDYVRTRRDQVRDRGPAR
jgi:hypothetical protein